MSDVITNILKISRATDWSFEDTYESVRVIVTGLEVEEAKLLQDVIDHIMPFAAGVEVIRTEMSASRLADKYDIIPKTPISLYDNRLDLSTNNPLPIGNNEFSFPFLPYGLLNPTAKEPEYYEDEESSEPMVKCTPGEFAKKCEEDAVFKLGSNIERDLYELFSSGYKELMGMKEWVEAVSAQCEQNRAAMGSWNLNKSTLEDLDKIASNMGVPGFNCAQKDQDGENMNFCNQLEELKKALEVGNYCRLPDLLIPLTITGTCDHKKRHYVSFDGREEFDYCEKCEEKL